MLQTSSAPVPLRTATSWTAKYIPINLLETFESNSNTLELDKTLEYMKRYGVDNVRGGPWCQIDIQHHLSHINNIIASIEDQCYFCNKKGHLKNKCPLLQPMPVTRPLNHIEINKLQSIGCRFLVKRSFFLIGFVPALTFVLD